MSSIFILMSAFFTRLTLILYFSMGIIPKHDTPIIADVLGFLFAPKLMIAWWMYIAGMNPFLITLFIVLGLLEIEELNRREDE